MGLRNQGDQIWRTIAIWVVIYFGQCFENCFSTRLLFSQKSLCINFGEKWAVLHMYWAIFSQTHLVTLAVMKNVCKGMYSQNMYIGLFPSIKDEKQIPHFFDFSDQLCAMSDFEHLLGSILQNTVSAKNFRIKFQAQILGKLPS
jgi:hypothetical protein